MKTFTSLRLQNLLSHTGLVKLALVVLMGLAASIGRSQTSFASAQVLTGDWGSVVNTNTLVTPDAGAPSIAGFPPNHPLWYQWTAPADGEVELDTIGSIDLHLGAPLDTVLGVYTGSSVSTLTQVAANDDIYNKTPYQQYNYTGQNIYQTNFPNFLSMSNPVALTTGLTYFYQPLSGPSGLRFNATAGTTYYFAVDTKIGFLYGNPFQSLNSIPFGQVSLTWAFHSSGVFRFATENVDLTGNTSPNGMPMLLYQCAETEGQTPVGEFGNIDAQTVVHTYYQYNNPGVLVTVTRVAGSSGRVWVDYYTVPGSTNAQSGDLPATPGVDYLPVSGTLIFDDFEMSKTILIPIGSDGGVAQPNRDFTLVLTNAQLDPYESSDVSPPRVDPNFGQARVRILDVDIDPRGESVSTVLVTNFVGTNAFVSTNTFYSAIPTNAVLNFQKAHYRVGRDVTNYWGGTPVTVYVNRTGTNTGGATVNWRMNNYFLELQAGYDQQNQLFPLQPGSDYAMPDPPNANGLIVGMSPPDNPDFTSSSGSTAPVWFGTLNWGANDFRPKAIHFIVYDNGLTEFNMDLSLQLYIPDSVDPNVADQVGMVTETTVTILADDQSPAPGSVDELYNADYNLDMALPAKKIPVTSPQNNPNPGTDGEVYDLAVLTNNETVIVGDFFSYNGFGRNCIALLTTNGSLDASFAPSSGANNFINAVAVTANNQFVIGGGFSSFNGAGRNGIARVNANGSLDPAFQNGLAGADGTVWAVVVQPNGQVLIGGDFTHVNGTPRNHLARLNTDGSLDATFDPGTTINGSVYALALQPFGGTQIFAGGSFAVSGQGYNNIALLNGDGSLNTSFNPGTGPDNSVFAVCWQPNGQVLLGGAFANINGTPLNGIARLNADGSLDTAGFSTGTGANNTVNCILYGTNIITGVSVTNNNGTLVTNSIASTNNIIYVGGSFTAFNGTHRLGFTRLYTDGTVDTTFLDTAFNQFAGLPQIYFSDSPGTVYATGLQNDGNVMIAGSFDAVGGGQADKNVRNNLDAERGIAQSFGDPNLWVSENNANLEPKTRDGVRSRSNVARLIGGSINGAASLVSPVNAYAPGNVGLLYNSYSANESQSFRNVELTRANGGLGPVGVNFAIQPGLAQSGVDYVYNASSPLYWITWENTVLNTRMHSDGLFGTNGVMEDIYGRPWWGGINAFANLTAVQVTVHPDPTVRGNLNAQFQLANPDRADRFYLGGQNIPLGVALGNSSAPFTLIDDNQQSGQFGFSAASFIATNTTAAISVLRSNGTYGTVSLKYSTSNGTAQTPADYTAISPPVSLSFNNGVLSNGFTVTVKNNGFIYTNFVEKDFFLQLSSLNGPVGGGATYGISNAMVRLINPNYKGYVSFSATNYTGNETAGAITFVVNRTSGNLGALSVQYATTNGTALNGVDYVGATNTLSWISGDVSSRLVTLPLINTLTVGASKQFAVSLRNPLNNGVSDPSILGLITNATLTISNDNSYGTLQLSATNYLVNENGGYATITVVRTIGAAGSVSVHYATGDGPHAVNGINYVGTSGVLSFAANQIAASFIVPIINDGVRDNTNFYFNVTLSSPVNAALAAPTAATVSILDAQTFSRPPGSPGTGTNSISSVNGTVLALALQSNGQLLVGGSFTQVNSVPENYITRLNADGSLDTAFQSGLSGVNGPVDALVNQTNGRILIGGSFTSVNGVFLNYVARLMTDGSLDTSFNPGSGANGPVDALAETFIGGVRKIYVGGAFGSINNVARPDLARLNDNGTLDNTFATGLGPDGAVYAVAVYPTNSIYAGKVLIGGAFTHYNGTNLNYLARLNADGSVDTTFNPGSAANGAISAIAIQLDGRVLVGGGFINFNGVPLNRIARLNADGSLDGGFSAAVGSGVNNTVTGIALQPDNRIVLVGLFSQVNGLTYNRIARLLPSGAVDGTINFGDGANSDVDAVVLQPWDGMIVLGGAFTQFNDQPYEHLVRLYGGSMGGSITSGGSLVIPAGSALVQEGFTPPNGIIDPGENVTLSFAFTNSAGNYVSNLVATLLATNGITAPSGPQSYGPLSVGGLSVARQFSFTANGTNGQTISATFQLQNGTNNLGLGVFNYLVGTLTNTFSNSGLIIINDNSSASPYPSTINVSGVGGSLVKATVTFANLTHTWPADIDALLESPSQRTALLMANAGAGNAAYGVTLGFDDAASAYLPQAAQIVSGTYKPTAYFPVAVFPAPAPSAPYATNLSSLYPGNPNGGWSLFVIDHQAINAGVISNGWSITLVTASPVPPLIQPPQFGTIVVSNGSFQLTITSPTNPPASTIIQASTNLINWIPVYTSTPPFTFTDPGATNYPYRFYRAVSGP
ncbi:MAG: Calx-beta domain-containing protein [Verrucomicrobiia bacterium]